MPDARYPVTPHITDVVARLAWASVVMVVALVGDPFAADWQVPSSSR